MPDINPEAIKDVETAFTEVFPGRAISDEAAAILVLAAVLLQTRKN